ncbi:MAG: nuclear transport factor 2 family protein [Gammaproteobacteria bacterium]
MTTKEHNSTGTSHKDAPMAFLRLVASGKAREAFQSHVAPDFRHHNPFFRGDKAPLMIAIEENAAKNQNKVLEIRCALEDGDLVAVHSHVRKKPGEWVIDQGFPRSKAGLKCLPQ